MKTFGSIVMAFGGVAAIASYALNSASAQVVSVNHQMLITLWSMWWAVVFYAIGRGIVAGAEGDGDGAILKGTGLPGDPNLGGGGAPQDDDSGGGLKAFTYLAGDGGGGAPQDDDSGGPGPTPSQRKGTGLPGDPNLGGGGAPQDDGSGGPGPTPSQRIGVAVASAVAIAVVLALVAMARCGTPAPELPPCMDAAPDERCIGPAPGDGR